MERRPKSQVGEAFKQEVPAAKESERRPPPRHDPLQSADPDTTGWPNRAGRALRRARLRNEVAAGGFAEQAGGRAVAAGIAVFFATGPEISTSSSSGAGRWNGLAERPVFMIVDRPTPATTAPSTSLPLAFARGSAALEELVGERDVRIVLYLNQLEANFRMLRFASPVHIQIGHGE